MAPVSACADAAFEASPLRGISALLGFAARMSRASVSFGWSSPKKPAAPIAPVVGRFGNHPHRSSQETDTRGAPPDVLCPLNIAKRRARVAMSRITQGLAASILMSSPTPVGMCS